jgi:hypothetical protein
MIIINILGFLVTRANKAFYYYFGERALGGIGQLS